VKGWQGKLLPFVKSFAELPQTLTLEMMNEVHEKACFVLYKVDFQQQSWF